MPGTFADWSHADDEDMWMIAPYHIFSWVAARREEHWELAGEYLRACFDRWRQAVVGRQPRQAINVPPVLATVLRDSQDAYVEELSEALP